jgi:PAS domain S-box-containing protein
LVRDENGEIIAVSGVARDISERKQKEKQLEEMYSRLQKVIDNAPFLINEIDPEGYYTLASEATCRFLGLSKEELIGKHFRDVLPQEIAETFQQRITQVYASGEERTVDDRLTADGEEHVFRTTLCPVYRDDKMIQSIVGIGYDATKQVEALQQKDFLLRELNHRVKNNLRMVSSLVELKDSALGDTVDLSDIRHQVQAIEKVHASLQESDQITHIQLKRYVEDILSTVFPSFTNQGVTIENEVLDISIRTKAAVPIGLIINETATNAIKHGFTGEEDARFSVTMEADAEERNYVLTISNTGQPLPEDVDIKNPQTLGLQLIQALVSQLQGTLAVERRPNPTFTIRFPKSQT